MKEPHFGKLVDGTLKLTSADLEIVAIHTGQYIMIQVEGEDKLNEFFAEGGKGGDLTFHIQTAEGQINAPIAGNLLMASEKVAVIRLTDRRLYAKLEGDDS